MSKATKALTPSRRQLLAGVPAAAVVGVAPAAARASSVTPALAKMIDQWKVARAEYLQLKAIDDAATKAYYRTAPEIPERIVASNLTYIVRSIDGGDELLQRWPEEQNGHLRYALRPDGKGRHTLKPSWWRLQVQTAPWHQCTDWLAENIHFAEEFEAADDAAYASLRPGGGR